MPCSNRDLDRMIPGLSRRSGNLTTFLSILFVLSFCVSTYTLSAVLLIDDLNMEDSRYDLEHLLTDGENNKLNTTRTRDDVGASFAVGTLLLQNITTTTNNSMIPKVINKILITGDGKTPQFDSQLQQQRDALLSWTNMNPGYTIRYFGLDDCRSYLQKYFHPAVLRAFDCMKANAWKVNVFRAAVLYREGGWYSDWKETVLHKGLLDEVSNADIVFTWDRGTTDHRKRGCIMNGFFGALPGDPMLGEAIKIMVTNAQREFYGLDPQTYGPCAFGEAFNNTYKKTRWRRNGRIKVGMYKWNDYYLNHGKNNVIRHKYHDPSGLVNDSWAQNGGNDYRKLWAERQSFCSSAISIIDPNM